jgi:hypothetical protein
MSSGRGAGMSGVGIRLGIVGDLGGFGMSVIDLGGSCRCSCCCCWVACSMGVS